MVGASGVSKRSRRQVFVAPRKSKNAQRQEWDTEVQAKVMRRSETRHFHRSHIHRDELTLADCEEFMEVDE